MKLRDLEYLVALDEHRHFGKAAAACYASQPTLSTQIRKLETELGVTLVERGSRQVILTSAGDEVVRRARHLLAEAEDIKGIARLLRDPESGSLRLGVIPTLAPYLLPHVVPKLAERFPDLEVLLTEEKTEYLREQLRTGGLDAIIVALPLDQDNLVIEPLFTEEFLLAVPVGHPMAKDPGEVVSADLVGQDLLLLGEGHCLRDQALEVCREAGAGERTGFRATSMETLRLMVAAGVGMTLIPELAAAPPVMQNPNIVMRRFAEPAPTREMALVWRATSVYGGLLPRIAAVLRELPDGALASVHH